MNLREEIKQYFLLMLEHYDKDNPDKDRYAGIDADEILSKFEKKTQILINKYKRELNELELNQDAPNFEKTFNGARRLLLLDIIEDLEGLLK